MDVDELKSFASLAMDIGEKQAPDDLEIFIQFTKKVSINIFNAAIAGTEQITDHGLGIRIVHGKKVGNAFTTDFSRSSIEKSVVVASKIAKKGSLDETWNGLPAKSGRAPAGTYFYPDLVNTSIEELGELTAGLLEECKLEGVSDPIIPFEGYSRIYSDCTVIMNSNGIETADRNSYFQAHLGAMAKVSGKVGPECYDYYLSRKNILADPSSLARKVAKDAHDMATPEKVQLPDKVPVVFRPQALLFIAAYTFLPAVCSDIKQQGSSYLGDRLGEEILPEEFNMWDDGTLPACPRGSSHDDEGTSTKKTPIIEKGVFKNFIYNHSTAVKDGTASTGNAERIDVMGVNNGAYANAPSVLPTNWVIETGRGDLEDLISDIKLGILVNNIQGAHQSSKESGDFTGVVNPGRIIRNGELSESVVGIGIAGNILDLFNRYEGSTGTAKTIPSFSESLPAGYLPYTRFGEMRVIT